MSLANFSTEVNWRDARNESLDKFWCDIYFSVSLESSEQFGRKNICLAEVSECFFPCTLQLNLARPFCLWETRLIAPLKPCYTWCNLLSFFIFLLAVTCQNTCTVSISWDLLLRNYTSPTVTKPWRDPSSSDVVTCVTNINETSAAVKLTAALL